MPTQETKPDAQTMKNDHLTLTVTRSPHCRVKFDIQVEPTAVAAAHAKALKVINKEANIPGFRKGKAPERLILEKYGSAIQKEWVDIVLQTAFNEALQLTHVHPLRDGYMSRPNIHECSLEKGANLTIEFEIRPEIPSVDVQNITIQPVVLQPVTEQDIQQTLKRLAQQFATYDPIEDRPVQEGDFVDVTVDLLQNGQTNRIADNYRTQTNEEGFPQWLHDKLLGLQTEQTVEGEVPLQEGEDPSEAAARPQFKLSVNKILKGNIPVLDDELAKKAGVETLEELKTKIEERLTTERQQEATEQQLEQLDHLLLQQYAFDVPRSLIEKNIENRLEEHKRRLNDRGQAEEFNKNKAQFKQAIEEGTIQQIQLQFLLSRLGHEQNIEVTSDDITQELSHQLSLMSSGQSHINLSKPEENLREQLHTTAFYRKIREFLLDKASYTQ